VVNRKFLLFLPMFFLFLCIYGKFSRFCFKVFLCIFGNLSRFCLYIFGNLSRPLLCIIGNLINIFCCNLEVYHYFTVHFWKSIKFHTRNRYYLYNSNK